MKAHFRLALIFAVGFFGFHPNALAWGRRGHSTIAYMAAYVLAQKNPDLSWLKFHSYDLGYYANTPDFFWKTPNTYQIESVQHYLDLDYYLRVLKSKKANPFNPIRAQFEAAHPEIPAKQGQAFWRISEMDAKLAEITAKLKNANLGNEEHRRLQGQWLTTAGELGHYMGDMSMPLHCTENHDGQMTNQKGIHSFFEDVMVNELYPHLQEKVYKEAKHNWTRFHKAHKDQPAFDLALELCRSSLATVPKLLAIDKKVGRKNLKRAAHAYEHMITERLALGSLYLAEVWGRHLGWKFDNHRYYFFAGSPDYVTPDEPTAVNKTSQN